MQAPRIPADEASRLAALRELEILDTPPVYTSTIGSVEVRVITWRRDWIEMVWALKSFYHYSIQLWFYPPDVPYVFERSDIRWLLHIFRQLCYNSPKQICNLP